jgi:hypothetical protein
MVGRMAQEVECLPSTCEVLSSNPSEFLCGRERERERETETDRDVLGSWCRKCGKVIHLQTITVYKFKNTFVGFGGSKDKMSQCPISHESTMNPTSCKGTCTFTSHGPLGMPQNATKPINRRLSQDCVYVLQRYVKRPLHPWLLTPLPQTACFYRDMLRDHSTPDSWLPSPKQRVFTEIC